MNTIRAKMTCQGVAHTEWGADQITLYPVTNGSPEDNSYASATPAGHVELTISNPDAQGFFVTGKTYFVDFKETT